MLLVSLLLILSLQWSLGKTVLWLIQYAWLVRIIIVNTASCSQNQPAVCVETVRINENPPNDVRVPSGTTCFQCVSSNAGLLDATFTIDNEMAGSIDGVMVVGGTLVITNSENIFNVLSPTQIKCEAPRICHQLLVLYDCKHLSYMSAITLTSTFCQLFQ